MFFSVLCLLCLCARLFICALWSPAGKGLTSQLCAYLQLSYDKPLYEEVERVTLVDGEMTKVM